MATRRSARCAEVKARSYEGGKIEFEHIYFYDFTSQDVRSTDNYHRGLFKFFVRQMVNYEKKKAEESGKDSSMLSDELFLSVLRNPDIPSVMTVQNKHGDMVRILCEEDFVAALSGYHSWEKCLLIEGYNYKPAPTVSRQQAAPAQRVQPAVRTSAQQQYQAEMMALQQRELERARVAAVIQSNMQQMNTNFGLATGIKFGSKPCGTALGTWCHCHGT